MKHLIKMIKIIAKTEKGIDAIKQHIAEHLKMNRLKRAAVKRRGYNQEVTCETPFTLSIWSTPGKPFSIVKPKHTRDEIKETLLLNGAKINQDYIMELK